MQTTSPDTRNGGRLLAFLGVTFGIAITVGNTAGIGILRSPSAVAAAVPSVGGYLAIWLAGGAYALMVALAYATLAVRTGRSGGPYTWLRESFGEPFAFAIGWIDWLATCGVLAVAAAVLGEYAVGLAPEFRAREVIGLMVIVLVTVVQSVGQRAAAWLQYGTVVLKILALGVFVVACIYFGTRSVDSAALVPDHDGPVVPAVMLALLAVIVTVHGAGAASYFAGEIGDRAQTLRKAAIAGITIVLALYMLVNWAILLVVPLPTIAGRGVALDVVSERIFGENGALLARGLVVLALLSAVNAAALIGPRILQAMGEDGAFFRAAGEVNRRGTPEVGLLITAATAGGLVILHAEEWLMSCVVAVFLCAAAASFLALWRTGTARLMAIAGFAASVALLGGVAFADPAALGKTAGLAVAGFLAYFGLHRRAAVATE